MRSTGRRSDSDKDDDDGEPRANVDASERATNNTIGICVWVAGAQLRRVCARVFSRRASRRTLFIRLFAQQPVGFCWLCCGTFLRSKRASHPEQTAQQRNATQVRVLININTTIRRRLRRSVGRACIIKTCTCTPAYLLH